VIGAARSPHRGIALVCGGQKCGAGAARLGHHSASFTLDTYVHLLDNDLGEPLQGLALPSEPT
jgi:integrase